MNTLTVPPMSIPPPITPRSPSEAIDALLARVRPAGRESLAWPRASGRVLAQELRSDRPSPAADLSAMDGYAVRAADVRAAPGGRLTVAGEARIGHEPPPMPSTAAACLRIATGSPVPAGADAVIRREDVTETPGDAPGEVRAIVVLTERAASVKAGDNIRFAGQNAPGGALIASPGTVITPPLAGAMASFGSLEVAAFRALRIVVLNTGDEVVPIDTPAPPPWRLRDSNGPALRALLGRAAWIADIDSHHAPDDDDALDRAIRAALESCDALLLTGGVSMGHRDLVPGAIARHGVETVFHRVPQRPGRPVLGGVTRDGRPVFGLPGNPVSVLVAARRMAWPVLMRRAGVDVSQLPCPAAIEVVNPDQQRLDLWWQRLVRLTGPGRAELVDGRGSGDVVAAARSDGFIELPPGATGPGPWPFYAWHAA